MAKNKDSFKPSEVRGVVKDEKYDPDETWDEDIWDDEEDEW